MKKVLIMAGGTGGHVFPALAVAEVLRDQQVSVAWIGTRRGIEYRLVPEAGITLHCISAQGLRGNGLTGWLMAPLRLLKAIAEARKIIKAFQPDVVLGLGGFASGPGGVAAWLSRIPVVIHEQNAIAGLTNKLLAPLSKQVLLGFENSFSGKKTTWVGNPVRQQIESMAVPAERFSGRQGPLKILVLGGSLGAQSLNRVVPAAVACLAESQRPVIQHQCGEKHLSMAQQAYQDAEVSAQVVTFITDMAAAYAEADLVICRAGALTVAEIAAAGVAAILVPYPYAVDDHQTANASALADCGAAILVDDKTLTVAALSALLNDFSQDRQRLLTMAENARTLARTGSANAIAARCLEVANG
ncbi:UDP-N-acetylglucosamine--N-acetylmuramyl- (pentapeptide) pyrophosphoryl-undecaprenol N-acetylglucosamine transferase [Methylophaga frappieri]|uniref:UDP-N-acetylglucosamine--N-acetylmuramyl-(pentapeptide) pyrophosphoryl-undecaprenol N-acetylglucosamine transferase n=1 Tax=Methylophaga frappieri (strain ATCC BAA-2434 / DSM 25690 / JAM7) TaxID=754477 RepID=I1YGJ5_METFJ|nr:undecaprenyldiphospho-muramoylpentapeptide beta-N-acetylglucosaminyltransferase [Methylophaga frappieri]AFJ02038.1 UDP-N-acetylglucosamine--N-acetylmuramyl- (pentapeptide) pyrophosphoryl-undecaprenol N-acetylglucosamine transferase [Methylophaga frappieri]